MYETFPLTNPMTPFDIAREEAWTETGEDPAAGKLVHPAHLDEAAATIRARTRAAQIRRRLEQVVVPVLACSVLLGMVLLVARAPLWTLIAPAAGLLGVFLWFLWEQHISDGPHPVGGWLPVKSPFYSYSRSSYSRSNAVLDEYYVTTRDHAVLWDAAEKADRRCELRGRIADLKQYDSLSPHRAQELAQLERDEAALAADLVRILDPGNSTTADHAIEDGAARS